MFDLGNDDKKKLRDNMEEIKQLINNGADGREQPDDTADDQPEQPFSAPEPETETPAMEQEPAVQDTFEEPEPAQEKISDAADELEELQDSLGASQASPTPEPVSQPEPAEPSEPALRENADPEPVPEPQGPRIEEGTEAGKNFDFTQEREAEEIESGETIFLTVERFEGLMDRLEEMRYLSQELRDVVDHLEAGVNEDEDTADEAQRLLDDFGQRRAEVEDIVLSHED